MSAKYCKKKLIGSGTFGKVWLATTKTNNTTYALKEVNLMSMNPEDRNQALIEVSVLARCKHKNIIRYREAMLDDRKEILCIVMEYAEGGDLYTAIQKQRGVYFKENCIMSWFIQICLALQYIHNLNILHRDLKTQNIYLTRNKLIKIGDFGISRILQESREFATTVIGTPFYISPEICLRKPYNYKSDIWALGCILFEMAALSHPFKAKDYSQLVSFILKAKRRELPRNCSPLIEDLVSILLNENPEKRPSTEEIMAIPTLQSHITDYLRVHGSKRSDSSEISTISSTKEGPRRFSSEDILFDVQEMWELKRKSPMTPVNSAVKVQRAHNVPIKRNSVSVPYGKRSTPKQTDCKKPSSVSDRNKYSPSSIPDKVKCSPSSVPDRVKCSPSSVPDRVKCSPSSIPDRVKCSTSSEPDRANYSPSSVSDTVKHSPSSGTYVMNRKSSIEEPIQTKSPGLIGATEMINGTPTRMTSKSFDRTFSKGQPFRKSSNDCSPKTKIPSIPEGHINDSPIESKPNEYELHIKTPASSSKRSGWSAVDDDVFMQPEDPNKFDIAKYVDVCAENREQDHCQHSSQCQQCMLVMLWKNRIRNPVGDGIDSDERSRLKTKLHSVFGQELFENMYKTLAFDWKFDDQLTSKTVGAIINLMTFDQVQHVPLLMQLIQLDFVANAEK